VSFVGHPVEMSALHDLCHCLLTHTRLEFHVSGLTHYFVIVCVCVGGGAYVGVCVCVSNVRNTSVDMNYHLLNSILLIMMNKKFRILKNPFTGDG
jgi:hypothetical protein